MCAKCDLETSYTLINTHIPIHIDSSCVAASPAPVTSNMRLSLGAKSAAKKEDDDLAAAIRESEAIHKATVARAGRALCMRGYVCVCVCVFVCVCVCMHVHEKSILLLLFARVRPSIRRLWRGLGVLCV